MEVLKPVVIGICGGSGSGKTTLAKALTSHWGADHVGILLQDSYYHDQSDTFDHDGGTVNFDHPSSLDFDQMLEDLVRIKKPMSVELPLYDFSTHSRKKETMSFPIKPIVIVDGILLFSQEKVRDVLDYKIFVKTPESDRLQRRIDRDVSERGRTRQGVLDQFYAHVKPMHDKYIEPYQAQAHLVVSGLKPVDDLVSEVIQLVVQ